LEESVGFVCVVAKEFKRNENTIWFEGDSKLEKNILFGDELIVSCVLTWFMRRNKDYTFGWIPAATKGLAVLLIMLVMVVKR
jgi:hypothetical protein